MARVTQACKSVLLNLAAEHTVSTWRAPTSLAGLTRAATMAPAIRFQAFDTDTALGTPRSAEAKMLTHGSRTPRKVSSSPSQLRARA